MKVTINNVEWRVFFVDKTHTELVDDDGEQVSYGVACLRECEIYIDRELSKDYMRQIITHELTYKITDIVEEWAWIILTEWLPHALILTKRSPPLQKR